MQGTGLYHPKPKQVRPPPLQPSPSCLSLLHVALPLLPCRFAQLAGEPLLVVQRALHALHLTQLAPQLVLH